MSKSLIICAFAGCGKTYAYQSGKYNCIDIDSSQFSWVYEGSEKRFNPDFPDNYIEYIKKVYESGKYDYIFVGSHNEVRLLLHLNDLNYICVCPDPILQKEWIERCKNRENNKFPIEWLEDRWEYYISGILLDYQNDIDIYVLNSGEYLTDVLDMISDMYNK